MRSIVAQASTHKRPSGRGRGAGFSDNFRVPMSPDFAVVRVIKSSYDQLVYNQEMASLEHLQDNPYALRKRHYVPASKKYLVCSGGIDPNNPEPCAGCQLNQQRVQGSDGKTSRRASLRDEFLITVTQLGFFQLVQKRNPNTGSEFTEHEYRGLGGRNMQFDPQAEDIVWGYRQWWALPRTHFNSLFGYAEINLNTCCKFGGEIYPVAFSCTSCGQGICTTNEPVRMTDDQAREFAASAQRCPHCGYTGAPEIIPDCSCLRTDGTEIDPAVCNNTPSPISIYEVDLKVWKDSEHTLHVERYNQEVGMLPFVHNSVAAGWAERWEELNQQIDMERFLQPKSYEDQLKHLKMTAQEVAGPNGTVYNPQAPTAPQSTVPEVDYS